MSSKRPLTFSTDEARCLRRVIYAVARRMDTNVHGLLTHYGVVHELGESGLELLAEKLTDIRHPTGSGALS